MTDYDYSPHPILGLSPEKLLEATLDQLRIVAPELKIGCQAYSGEHVWQGKKVPPYLTLDTVVQLDRTVPHVNRPYVELGKSQIIKIYFADPHGFDAFKGMTGFLYPCSIDIPHKRWLLAARPGDTVNLHDAIYDTSPYTLTNQDFADHSYVTFRYILSDEK